MYNGNLRERVGFVLTDNMTSSGITKKYWNHCSWILNCVRASVLTEQQLCPLRNPGCRCSSTLSEFAEGSSQTKIDAESLLQQLQTKRFIFLLVAFSKLFTASDFATKSLQSPSVSVTDCIHMIDGLKETFATFRSNSDGKFERIIRLTDDIMKKNYVQNWDVAGALTRKMPAKFADSHVASTVGRCAPIMSDSDLQSMWIMILDRQLVELNNRFQSDSYGIMKVAASLLPASDAFCQFENTKCAFSITLLLIYLRACHMCECLDLL